MATSCVSTWYGVFLVTDGRVVRSLAVPPGEEAARERSALRRSGQLTPEEATMLADPGARGWVTRDRRLGAHGPRYDPDAPAEEALPPAPPRSDLRRALIDDGDRALRAAWDPSVHVQEAVRAAADLDRVRNLVGERLGAWVARDHPEVDPGDHDRAAREALQGTSDPPLAPPDPSLTAARKQLAELYRSVELTRHALAQSVEATAPVRAPNVAALLGPELAARLIAQAGGLERLARLPSSTVQVLGAERAFFEHLRGKAPPPRHGLLFVHPSIQSAPKGERGKLARALAGKVSIAARLDAEGAPLRPELKQSFETRRDALRARRGSTRPPGGRRRSRLPLDRAPRDR